jgi:hypothetical protein
VCPTTRPPTPISSGSTITTELDSLDDVEIYSYVGDDPFAAADADRSDDDDERIVDEASIDDEWSAAMLAVVVVVVAMRMTTDRPATWDRLEIQMICCFLRRQ